MKRFLYFFVLTLLPLTLLKAQTTFPPIGQTHIIDEPGILSTETKNALEHLLTADEDTSGNQVMVLIINSLNGNEIAMYANEAYNHYRLGQDKTNNGVLLLVAFTEHRVRIEVGYGLEGELPDALCGRIINNEITPYFKQGDYDAGVTNGVNSILQAIQGTYTAPESGDGIPFWVALVFVLGCIVVIVVLGALNKRIGGGYHGGGYYGGGWSSGSGGGWSGGGGGGWSGGGGGFSGGGGASGSW